MTASSGSMFRRPADGERPALGQQLLEPNP
jgi:hypothetical protein